MAKVDKQKLASEEALGDLHVALAKALQKVVSGNSATAADLSAAAKFLKDNGISHIGSMNPEDVASQFGHVFGDGSEDDEEARFHAAQANFK